MKHYVCAECGATSQDPTTCQTTDCMREGMPLKVCFCSDGKHQSTMNSWKNDDVNEDEQADNSKQKNKTLNLDEGDDSVEI